MPNGESFIRWAGGKQWLVNELLNIINNLKYNNYYEPFLGSGAIFFSMNHPKHCYLSDINEDLINTYIHVRDNPNLIIERLKLYTNTEEKYYEIRNQLVENPIEKAAKFIYLNQTSYNGLYRVNKKVIIMSHMAIKKNWNYNYNKIIVASEKLQKTKISCSDFEKYKYRIKENDLVFFDPPYTVSHEEKELSHFRI